MCGLQGLSIRVMMTIVLGLTLGNALMFNGLLCKGCQGFPGMLDHISDDRKGVE